MPQPACIVVASVAEVGRTKAEEDGKRAAVSALVLHKLSPMMLTHLKKETYYLKPFQTSYRSHIMITFHLVL